MLKTHGSISIEGYLLENYSKLGVTDKEFIMLLHFLAIPETGKNAWRLVSERMGYSTESTISKLINSLVEKNLLELSGRGYDLDATKLYDACLQIMDKPETIDIVITKKPKKEKMNPIHYIIAEKIIKDYGSGWSKDGLAQRVKSLIEEGVDETKFIDWIHYMDSGNRWYKNKGMPKSGIRVDRMIYSNYQDWINAGCPTDFTTNNSNLEVL